MCLLPVKVSLRGAKILKSSMIKVLLANKNN